MTRQILPALLAATLLVLPASAQTQSWDIEGFDRIDASAGVRIIFETAQVHSVTAQIERGGREDVKVDLDGDTLELSRKGGWGRRNTARVTFRVTAPSLEAIEVSSGVSMSATGIDAQFFKIDASSGSSLTLSGRCGALEIDASSGTSIDASSFECLDLDVDASSGSSVRAHARGEIRADASSGASIQVAGGGEAVDIEKSSGASIRIEPRDL